MTNLKSTSGNGEAAVALSGSKGSRKRATERAQPKEHSRKSAAAASTQPKNKAELSEKQHPNHWGKQDFLKRQRSLFHRLSKGVPNRGNPYKGKMGRSQTFSVRTSLSLALPLSCH